MDIDVLNIRIIDTVENDRDMLLEQTQVSSPQLIYNGQDDKFGNLMTSELHFNLLVKSAEDAVFWHLFTGSETRFKVQLEDVSDEENPVIIWEGFLLPEQFSEPYDNGNFFVEFVATDGIGRLKEIPLLFFNKESVIAIIGRCLQQTGLDFPIHFAPAIQNSGFELNYKDLEIDTRCYVKDDESLKAYEVLNHVLKAIACRLFSFNKTWYVIGLNRFDEADLELYKYHYSSNSLSFLRKEVLNRALLTDALFETNPSIGVLPPLKKVTTNWDWNADESLIPEDVVNHYPEGFRNGSSNREIKYWSLKTNKNIILRVWLIQLDPDFNYSGVNPANGYNGFAVEPDLTKRKDASGPFVFFKGVVNSVSDLQSNYADLINPFYVSGDEDLDRYASLKIEFSIASKIGVTDERLQTALDADDFANSFHFAITRKEHKGQGKRFEELLYSTLDADDYPDGFLDYNLSVKDNGIFGSLDLKKIQLLESGYYNIRIYPVVSHALLIDTIIYEKLSLTLKQSKTKTFVRSRNIDFTQHYKIDIYHSSGQMTNSQRVYQLSDAIQNKLDNRTLIEEQVLVVPRFFIKTAINTPAGYFWYNVITVGLSDSDFNKCNNGYTVFVKKAGTTQLVSTVGSIISVKDDEAFGGKVIWQSHLGNSGSNNKIEQGDQIFLKLADFDSIDYKEYWRTKWRRIHESESVDFIKALTGIYHDLLFEPSFFMKGNLLALFSPLELLRFKFKGLRKFMPTRLTLDLVNGRSELTLIESKTSLVKEEDSEVVQPVLPSVPDVAVGDPSITAYSRAYLGTGLVFSNWRIATTYTITNIFPVNAIITAKHYSAMPSAGGVETGYVLERVLTVASGVSTFTFPLGLAGSRGGVYGVQIKQGDVESDVNYVIVAPSVNEVKRIVLTKLISYDYKVLKYRINFENFDVIPVTLVQETQKRSISTQLPIGSVIYETLTNIYNGKVLEYRVPSSGSWGLVVRSGVLKSNAIGKFGF